MDLHMVREHEDAPVLLVVARGKKDREELCRIYALGYGNRIDAGVGREMAIEFPLSIKPGS